MQPLTMPGVRRSAGQGRHQLRSRRRWLALGAIIAAGAVLVAALSTGGTHRRAAVPRSDGLVEIHDLAYRSSLDGSRVTGLVATPRASASRGCVIWQNGVASKEDASHAWLTLASLGLTTFSTDLRHQGAGAPASADLEQAARDPKGSAELVRRAVADLRNAIDQLENRPYCRRNIAYVGISLGGVIGTLLAAKDTRVKAAAIMSTPGTFRGVVDPARFIGRISPRPVLILSGLDDRTIPRANARLLQAAARRPKTIVNYRGGHDPASGPDASGNAQALTSFLLRYVVEPTYGVSGAPDGTFVEP